MAYFICMCLAFALACTNVRPVNAATTMTPTGNQTHQHHEHTEMDNFSFNYDGHTKMLMVLTGTKCYIWQLTDMQKQSVHTDDGLRQIEIQVLGDIDNAMYTVVPQNILDTTILRACGHKTNAYYLVH